MLVTCLTCKEKNNKRAKSRPGAVTNNSEKEKIQKAIKYNILIVSVFRILPEEKASGELKIHVIRI